MRMMTQKGFTLIELMISMVIGLIIIAAVVQVYVLGIKNASVQKAASGVLDANIFGLQKIEQNLRMTGLGLGETSDANKACSGVIISKGSKRLNCDGSEVTATSMDIYTAKIEGKKGMDILPLDMRSRADAGDSNTSTGKTPQLTIQYRAPVDMRDCEGRLVLGPRQVESAYLEGMQTDPNTPPKGKTMLVDGQVVIERYFTKKDANGSLQLRCDAGRYVTEHIIKDNATKDSNAHILGANSSIKGIGDEGALVVADIDDFQIQFGVSTKNNSGDRSISFVDPKSYNEGEIVAIKTGILAKGTGTISQSDAPQNPSYELFGKPITLTQNQSTNVIRRVYEITTMLRNSREGK